MQNYKEPYKFRLCDRSTCLLDLELDCEYKTKCPHITQRPWEGTP
jgi:hypothetical protein